MQTTLERNKETSETSFFAAGEPDAYAPDVNKWLIDQYQSQLGEQNATRNYVSPISCLEALYKEQSIKMSKREEMLVSVRVSETNRFDVRNRRFVAELDARKLEKLVQAYRDGKYRRVAVLRRNQLQFEHSLQKRLLRVCQVVFFTCKERLTDTVQECRFALEQLSLYYN